MPATFAPERVSIPVVSFPHRGPVEPGWTGRRMIGTVLGVWAVVAAVLAAVVVAVVWDLRT